MKKTKVAKPEDAREVEPNEMFNVDPHVGAVEFHSPTGTIAQPGTPVGQLFKSAAGDTSDILPSKKKYGRAHLRLPGEMRHGHLLRHHPTKGKHLHPENPLL